MPNSFLLVLIFAGTFAFVIAGLYFASGWLGQRATVETGTVSVNLEPEEPVLLRTETVSSISFWAALLERFDFVPNLRRLIAEAGLDWSVGRFTALMLMAGASMAVVVHRVHWMPFLGVLAAGLLATLAPFFYVRHKRQKRFEQFELHFPDALDSLGRAMRAGHALAAGMDMVATEATPPVSLEFRKVVDEWRLGRSWDQALDHLVQRMPLVSVSLFVAAVRVQSRTGGKLHEVLGRISEGIRDSAALDGEIRALSAHGKMTGAVLTVLPIGIATMLYFTSPGYLEILFQHPIGKYLVMGAIGFLVTAHFVINKILDIRI